MLLFVTLVKKKMVVVLSVPLLSHNMGHYKTTSVYLLKLHGTTY